MAHPITVMLENSEGWEARADLVNSTPGLILSDLLFDSKNESNPDSKNEIAIAELLPLIMFSRGDQQPDVILVDNPELIDFSEDLKAVGTKVKGYSWLDGFFR